MKGASNTSSKMISYCIGPMHFQLIYKSGYKGVSLNFSSTHDHKHSIIRYMDFI